MLDEIDKLSASAHGDPTAALLEVLDPAQNATFRDHYLGLPFDLSAVMFIATANVLEAIPLPLRDRMEVIQLHGYTTQEKLQIARLHLLPRQHRESGLPDGVPRLDDEVLLEVIERYTREAGVRGLERCVTQVFRKIARKVAESGSKRSWSVRPNGVPTYLGVPKYRQQSAEKKDAVGVVTGLAWTEAGGEILPIEATRMPGKGQLILTGQLGKVMQESAQAAMSYVRSRAEMLGLEKRFLESIDVHVHVPDHDVSRGPKVA